MEKKKLFLLTLTGGKEVKAYLNDTDERIIKHNDDYNNIWIKTVQDEFIKSKDIISIEKALTFTNEEIIKISQVLYMEFDEVVKKIGNEGFAQFGNLEDFFIEKFDDCGTDEIIETMTDLFLPVCYSKYLSLEERIQDMFDNVVMLSVSNIVEIL